MSAGGLTSASARGRAFISGHVHLCHNTRAFGAAGWVVQRLVSQITGLWSQVPVHVLLGIHSGEPTDTLHIMNRLILLNPKRVAKVGSVALCRALRSPMRTSGLLAFSIVNFRSWFFSETVQGVAVYFGVICRSHSASSSVAALGWWSMTRSAPPLIPLALSRSREISLKDEKTRAEFK
eukprot:IDg18636t1